MCSRDFPFAQARLPAERDAHLVLVPNPPQHPAGDFGLERGLALPEAASQYTFPASRVYRPRVFRRLHRRGVSAQASAAALHGGGPLFRRALSGLWEDVGTKERLEALNGPPAGSPVTG